MAHQNLYPPESLAKDLADSLVEKGLLSSDQVHVAVKEQHLKGLSFEECIVELGFISEAALAEALALQSGYEKVDLSKTLLDPSLKSIIPQEIAEKFSLLPLSLEGDRFRVAMADVYDLEALETIGKRVGAQTKVMPVIALESEILEAFETYYGYDHSVQGVLREIEAKGADSLDSQGAINPTVRLVNAILLDAIKQKASDIHFEPEGIFMRLRYRIDGILIQNCTLHASYWPAICVRLKVLAGMNIAESRKPQNGRMTFRVGPREVDIRVASHPTVMGENIVVRILDKARSLLALDELGYSEEVINQITRALKRPDGLFIITGPTGCGKTTSLYSLLTYLNKPDVNIMTLEEPVEYKLPLIRQSEVREQGSLNFADGVRSILRQDPDIILIGEIRDPETAQMALRAAMTGHQVYTTLHTNDCLGAFDRLADLGLSRSLLAGNLMGVVAQRLVRRLCASCKKKVKMTPKEASEMSLPCEGFHYHAVGCSHCRETGYKGRLALAEVLVSDEELHNLLTRTVSRTTLISCALKKGYIPLRREASRRVLSGETSLEETQRVMGM